MKFSNFAVSALLAGTASASLSFWSSSTDITDDDSLSVPGDNPLKHCKDPEKDILEVQSVDIDPNPPLPGQALTVTAKGILNEDVEDGAKVKLQIKYGLITIINSEADLCESAESVDIDCPLEKGKISIKKSFNLPKEIPPGKYNVVADAYTKDDDKITCLTATVEFKEGAAAKAELEFKEDI